MKLQGEIVLGMAFLVAVAIAQDAPKANIAAESGDASSKPEAATALAAKSRQATATKSDGKRDVRALTEKEKRGYALGMQLSTDIGRLGIEVDSQFLLEGMRDALAGNKLRMTPDDVNAVIADMQREQHEMLRAALKELSDKNRKDGEAFLAANRGKEGVVALPSGLQYRILKEGDGKKPALNDRVVCNYRGTLIDGTEVDSSFKRNEPSVLSITGAIKGWTDALQLMPVGSKWQIFMPSELAYGDRGNGSSIGPNATLIFEVELLAILEKTQDPPRPQDPLTKPQGSM